MIKNDKPVIRALKIIRDNNIEYPHQFAELMWPDSDYWNHVYNVGNGAAQGVALNRSAGGYLGRLHHQGLIYKWYRNDNSSAQDIHLTSKGEQLLKDSE